MDATKFVTYIEEMLYKRGITVKELCQGICSIRQWEHIKNGERVPDNMLRNALLERLGDGSENYESYLLFPDYERWEMQMKILNCFECERWSEAEKYLDYYQEHYFDKDNVIEYQFILCMRGQIRRHQGADRFELQEIYQSAIELTVPDWEQTPIKNMVLSLKELNLLLELETLKYNGGRVERYLEIMNYVEKHFDSVGRVKIYPKAVCLLCGCDNEFSDKDLLRYCDNALEYLRNTSRMYYLWEILEFRGVFLSKRLYGIKKDNNEIRNDLQMILEQNRLWKEALESVYEAYHVRKDTYTYCYLYTIKGVYCINDVIRIRRKMLGISMEDLCGEDRGVRTIQRLEKKESVTRWKTVMELFVKLGLPNEFARNTLLTENMQVKRQMAELKRLINQRQWMDADMLMQNIRQQISERDKHNIQVLCQKEAIIRWHLGEIDTEEHRKRIRAALELTMPFDAFLKPGAKYLTYQEQTCIINLMNVMDKDSQKFKICVHRFEEYYAQNEKNGLFSSVDGTYGFIMGNVASELGNMGEFERANHYDEVMIEGYLRSRRLRLIPNALYDLWWNAKESRSEDILAEDEQNMIMELNKIIQLSNLDKQTKYENFYRRELHKIVSKDYSSVSS